MGNDNPRDISIQLMLKGRLMRLESDSTRVVIDFGYDERDLWSLLVIDDRWSYVQRMVCGWETRVRGTTKYNRGLGEDCLKLEAVETFWKESTWANTLRFIERALLRVPWMVHGTHGYGAVSF